MNTTYANFGDFLSAKRKERRLTVEKLANAIEVSKPYLIDVEKDRRNPFELEKLEKISQILELTIDEKNEMLDLAGKKRNSVAPDLPEIINENYDVISAALRTARDMEAGEAEWLEFIQKLKSKSKE